MSLYVKAFTDGSCKPNPGPGGWGIYCTLVHNETSHITFDYRDHGGSENTTNQQMELTAMLKFLEFCPLGCVAEIRSDSKYTLGGIVGTIKKEHLIKDNELLSEWFEVANSLNDCNGWLKNWINKAVKLGTPYSDKYWCKDSVANGKEWYEIHQRILVLLKNNTTLKFGWCKGHSGIEGNEIADQLSDIFPNEHKKKNGIAIKKKY